MFKGSITALITPFKNGEIDWSAFEKLVEWQIEQGTNALVPCGTTGESPTLTHQEHMAIVERCVNVAGGRVPVIAGAGSNATHEAIALSRHAKEAGADAVLIVTPYYNKPTQAGIIAHFKAIHEAVNIPIIIYNIPGRSVINIEVETMIALGKMPRIVGVKDATDDLARVQILREALGEDFALLSGEDATAPGYLALGGDGCISVASNVAPRLCADLHTSWQANDRARFAECVRLLAPLSRDLFCESSPAPVKYAAHKLGICSDEVRLPILPASEKARKKVDAALVFAGIGSAPAALKAHG